MAEADRTSGPGNMRLASQLLGLRLPRKMPGLLVVVIVMAAVMSAVVPGFGSLGTVTSMMFQLPELGMLAMAMMIPMLTGGLNLAVIATADASALAMVGIMQVLTPEIGNSAILVALVAGFALSLAVGALTGFLIARTKVHPILVTLGMMSIVQGVGVLVTRGKVVSGVPPLYGSIGNITVGFVPLSFVLFAVVALGVGILLRHSVFGVSLKLAGSNPEATRYSAVNVDRVIMKVYAVSGVLCFLASVLMVARFNSASAVYAKSYLLVTVLASVLGGVDPFGGFGEISGLFLALCVLQMIATGCNLLGLSDYLTLAIWGMILILVTSFAALRRR